MTEGIVPKCIGIIMDGNRRYAREHNIPQLIGHKKGLEKIKEVTKWSLDRGVSTIILYTFSTENWNRSEEEVKYLIQLFMHALDHELEEIRTLDIRIRFIGDLSRFPEKISTRAKQLQEDTKDAPKGTVALALSYGGRAEIVEAARQLVAEGEKEITEESFREALGSADLPDPDLIIRTGAEHRLSNFLLYQAAYSELFFTDTKWPAFSRVEFDSILHDFAQRERRHGR